MKIVVIGGTGLIGSKLVARLRQAGHEPIPASPGTGVNAVTGDGLSEALQGAEVVVDVANAPSFEASAVLAFFSASTRNLLAAEQRAGVRHHVALSVVGTERLLESGYFQGKKAQEDLIREGRTPFTIVRATQFYEFLGGIAQASAADGKVHLPPASIQPMSSDDVAAAMAEVALGEPVNGTVEIAGPERFRLDDLLRHYLTAVGDSREIVSDPGARYFGASLDDATLVPGEGARLGTVSLAQWLAESHPGRA